MNLSSDRSKLSGFKTSRSNDDKKQNKVAFKQDNNLNYKLIE